MHDNNHDLESLTDKELQYLKDEWNSAYVSLQERYKELELIHTTLTDEFKRRGVNIVLQDYEDEDTEEEEFKPRQLH